MERQVRRSRYRNARTRSLPVSAVAIIPARGGSKRIWRKNIKTFHGKPILAYSIETAWATHLFDGVIVSTDDDEIADVADFYGAAFIRREPDDGTRGTQAVVAEALQKIDVYDYCCCIYATAPMMIAEDLHLGYEKLRRENVPYVYSVGPDWMDAGQWYWGRSYNFLIGTPLDQAALYMLPAERVCDINTQDDWRQAETMYAAMKGLA